MDDLGIRGSVAVVEQPKIKQPFQANSLILDVALISIEIASLAAAFGAALSIVIPLTGAVILTAIAIIHGQSGEAF